MLVKNDVKTKLLEMKAKLLEVTDDKGPILEDYGRLAEEIDAEVFSSLINRIKNTNLHNLPFSEQLVVLDNIAEEYEDVYEVQCGFRNTYSKYTDDELELSDLSAILIDDINERRNIIQGYLINADSVMNNRTEIEKLNSELIEQNKKESNLARKYNELEDELKNNFLMAEGRNYGDEGNLVYNSIAHEYQDISLNLKELLANNNLIETELSKVNDSKIALDEKLHAARVCYEHIPTAENQEVLNSIKTDALKINYKLVLLYMVNLVSKKCAEYKSIILKREQIMSLNEERLNCLRQLGVKIAIDPFSKIRADEQIRIIKSLGDNSEKVEVIKKKICYLDSLIDEKNVKNEEYSLLLQDDIALLRQDKVVDAISNYEEVSPNKVINIKDLRKEFNRQRAKEKTNGVITRVFGMLNSHDVVDIPVAEVNPTLVVEPAISNQEEVPLAVEDKLPATSKEETFIDEVPFVSTEITDLPVVEDKPEAVISDDIFSDNIVPFSGVQLFEGKTDDNIFEDAPVANETVPLDTVSTATSAMPEVFWPDEGTSVANESDDAVDNVVNFDEQVAALIGPASDNKLVRKKVA